MRADASCRCRVSDAHVGRDREQYGDAHPSGDRAAGDDMIAVSDVRHMSPDRRRDRHRLTTATGNLPPCTSFLLHISLGLLDHPVSIQQHSHGDPACRPSPVSASRRGAVRCSPPREVSHIVSPPGHRLSRSLCARLCPPREIMSDLRSRMVVRQDMPSSSRYRDTGSVSSSPRHA